MSEFIKKCERLAEALGVEIIDAYDDGEGDTVIEDDGILHVTEGTTRVAFDVSNNQTWSAKKQNFITETILHGLKREVVKEALV